MELDLHSILRLKDVLAHAGFAGKGSVYRAVNDGTLPPPVRISSRCVGWPSAEISAINAGRIRGLSDDEIRQLVKRLLSQRKALPVPGE